jgi:glucose 1-dehydrogenase
MNIDLSGKVAIVTGANRGIGRGCAVELARCGANVTVNYRQHGGEAEEVAAEISRLGRQALPFQCDVADRAQIERMVAATVERFGRVDILINNAYASIRKPFLELEPEDVEKTWAVSLWGVFHATQLCARRMVQQGEGGKIVNISSVHAFIPFARSTGYNAAKAGINHMANTVATELVQHHINVNTIEPGWIDTPGERQFATEQEIREEGRKLPWGRLGTIEDIGQAAAFLCSPAADYITGAVLRVDGGFWLPVRNE